MRRMSALWSNTKVGLMMAGLTALLALAGQALGGSAGLTLALGMAAAGNLAMYYWSSTLVMRSYGARVVSAREAPALHDMVDRLRRRAGLPMPTVAIAPHAQPNAFATGRNERHAVVCVTQGLLDTLDREQLEGVIAHELAHIRHRDMLLMTVTATLAGAIGNLGNMLMFSSLFGSRDEEGPHPVAQLAVMLLTPIAAMLIQFAISRQREFRADALAAQLTGRPRALASALQSLEAGARRIPMAVSPTAAPLAQVNPLAASARGLAKLFSTHPPTAARVERLLAMEGGVIPLQRSA
ncbi:MAG TPA: zinc metalloprotease HtpX [Gemmatimonadaceae bacterium]